MQRSPAHAAANFVRNPTVPSPACSRGTRERDLWRLDQRELHALVNPHHCMHRSSLHAPAITACTGHHCMHWSSLHALVNPHHCMHWRYMGAHNSIECPLPTARYPRCHCSLPCPAFPLRTPHSPPNKTGCSLYLLEPLCQHRLQQQAHREISPRKIRLRICPNRSHTSNHTG